MSKHRKVAVGTWRPARDGRLYGRLAVDASAAIAYVDRLRAETGVRVTLTHVVGKAVAQALVEVPEFRTRVVLGRIVQHQSCDVSFAVDIDGGSDLGPTKVLDVDRKSVVDLAVELDARVRRMRARQDRDFETSSALVRLVPGPLLRPVLAVVSLLNGGLGIRSFGQPGFPLGSALVSNVGAFGLDEGFMAPVPFARAPLYVLVGTARDAALVEDGRVVVRPQLVVTAVADHRLVDGAHAGRLAAVVKAALAEPGSLDP